MSILLETPVAAGQRRPIASGLRPVGTKGTGPRQLPFALTIFLSAFLLFQVQLLLGKELLPLFGGAASVWTACMLVFQLLFLAGYGYAHGLAVRLPMRAQVLLHGALLAVSALFLSVLGRIRSTPISLGAGWRPSAGVHPAWAITEFLLGAIGLPFFLLSATSPLVQHWFAESAGRSPYRLYALSNVGSLLGLLSYPFLVEPHFGLRTQGWAWTAGYGLFLICYFFSARSAARPALTAVPGRSPAAHSCAPEALPGPRGTPPGWPLRLFWTGLAACASMLLLATTTLVSQDLAVSPFLWVLELSLYLLSFIVCFENDRWYRRSIFHSLLAVTVASVIVISLPNATYSYLMQLAAYSAVLFAGCMVCHGEAAQTRPSAPFLTEFYFCIATGGALGGVVAGVISPWMFPNFWEYPLGVLGCIAVVLAVSMKDRLSWWHTGRTSLALLILSGAVLLAPAVLAPVWTQAARLLVWLGLCAAALLAAGAVFAYVLERKAPSMAPARRLVRTASRIAFAVLVFGLLIPQKAALYHVIASSRDFYGVLAVVSVSDQNYLALRHGNILHGFQYQDRQRARLTTGYYGPNSGANLLIGNWQRHPMRVGLVGMGVGTLAALGQSGDVFRFYEIDPSVYKLSSGSRPYFTFLNDSAARIEVVLGDARLSLEEEARRGNLQSFDVLVLDAFSSDAIPMHLLTREAFSVYLAHLRGPASVIAVHISNQTVDLRPVLAGISREFGFHAVGVYTPLLVGPFSQTDWVLLSRDSASLQDKEIVQLGEPLLREGPPVFWTDDYCDLLRVIRWHSY